MINSDQIHLLKEIMVCCKKKLFAEFFKYSYSIIASRCMEF